MSAWIRADDERRVLEAQATSRDGWHRVNQTLNGRILTDDGISLYLWDGADNVKKRDDQSIERERRERRDA